MANKTTKKSVAKTKSAAKKNVQKKYEARSIIEDDDTTRMNNAITLDELMGMSSPNMFGARTEEEFDEKLDDMTLIDMHKLATKAGLLPVHDRTTMKKRLKTAFAHYVKSLRPFKMSNQKFYSEGGKMTKSAEQKARLILSGGR